MCFNNITPLDFAVLAQVSRASSIRKFQHGGLRRVLLPRNARGPILHLLEEVTTTRGRR